MNEEKWDEDQEFLVLAAAAWRHLYDQAMVERTSENAASRDGSRRRLRDRWEGFRIRPQVENELTRWNWYEAKIAELEDVLKRAKKAFRTLDRMKA